MGTPLARNDAWSEVSGFMVETHLKSGALICVLEDWSLEPNPIYIVYSPNCHLSARVRVFVEWLVELFEAKGLR
ncbi:LysR substrate-binding domain-containing protein [Pseudomonas sp. SDO524_S393]